MGIIDQNLCYYTQNFTNGETIQILSEKNKISIPFLIKIINNIELLIRELKNYHISLRDLHLENLILINEQIKLIDLGCLKEVEKKDDPLIFLNNFLTEMMACEEEKEMGIGGELEVSEDSEETEEKEDSEGCEDVEQSDEIEHEEESNQDNIISIYPELNDNKEILKTKNLWFTVSNKIQKIFNNFFSTQQHRQRIEIKKCNDCKDLFIKSILNFDNFLAKEKKELLLFICLSKKEFEKIINYSCNSCISRCCSYPFSYFKNFVYSLVDTDDPKQLKYYVFTNDICLFKKNLPSLFK